MQEKLNKSFRRFSSSILTFKLRSRFGFNGYKLKLCTSMNLFSRVREREKLKWIKQWFDYFIKKKQKQKERTLG